MKRADGQKVNVYVVIFNDDMSDDELIESCGVNNRDFADDPGDEVCGVFATLEAAEAACADERWRVETFVLDSPAIQPTTMRWRPSDLRP